MLEHWLRAQCYLQVWGVYSWRRHGTQESSHSSTELYNTQTFIRTWRMFWKRNYRTVRRTTLVFLDYYAVFLFDFFGNINLPFEKNWKIHCIFFFLFLKLSVMVLPVRYLVHVIPFVCFCLSGKGFPRILGSEVKIMRGCLQADIANLQSAKQSFIFSRSKNLFYFLWTLD